MVNVFCILSTFTLKPEESFDNPLRLTHSRFSYSHEAEASGSLTWPWPFQHTHSLKTSLPPYSLSL